jgi:hypothetical protein
MRTYGLACDNLLSVDVVTADGQLLTASATVHTVLFWAVRAAGKLRDRDPSVPVYPVSQMLRFADLPIARQSSSSSIEISQRSPMPWAPCNLRWTAPRRR